MVGDEIAMMVWTNGRETTTSLPLSSEITLEWRNGNGGPEDPKWKIESVVYSIRSG